MEKWKIIFGLLVVISLSGCIYQQPPQNPNREVFSACMSDGNMYWNAEKQECFERQPEQKDNCKVIETFSMLDIKTLPKYVNHSLNYTLVSDCNTTPDDFSFFECGGVEFRAWAVKEEVPYNMCIEGFGVGIHSGYGYQDVHFLGKDEKAEDYKGELVIPYDGCEIAYYEVKRDYSLYKKNVSSVELCW